MSKEGKRQERRTESRRQRKERLQKARERREFLKWSAIVLGGGAVAVGGGVAIARLIEGSGADSDEEIIRAAIEALGIRESQQEKDLWAQAYADIPQVSELDKETQPLVEERFFGTLERMRLSENPYYQDASNFLLEQVEVGKVEFKLIPQFSATGEDEGLAATVGLKDERLDYQFVVSQEFVLNRSSALTLADNIVHEVEHLKRFGEFFRALPETIADAEKLSLFESYYLERDKVIVEESFAYGKAADAYIYQVGLLGEIYAEVESGAEDRTAQFILNERDAESHGWREYIASILK